MTSRSAARANSAIPSALVSFERVFEVLDLEPLITEKPDAVAVPDGPASLEFDGVHFAYPAADKVSLASLEEVATLDTRGGQEVLHGASFRVEPGQLVALVGSSGSGKSTIASLAPRLYDVDSGTIRLGGVDVRDLTFDSIRQTLGMVTQDGDRRGRLGLGLFRDGLPEDGQEGGGPSPAGAEGDGQPAPAGRIEDAGRVIERPFARPEGAHGHTEDGEHHHVLPALAGPEDEEPVLEMVRHPGHCHGAHHPGPGKGGEEPGDEQRPGPDLGEAGQPGVEHTGPHPQAFEPATGPGDLPATEDVVQAVGQHHSPEREAQEQESEVIGIGHGVSVPCPKGPGANAGEIGQSGGMPDATLRIVGAGLPRTGSHSLKLALERLTGGRCYHMREIPGHPFDLGPGWRTALAGGSPSWADVLDGFIAAVDWPASMFWRQLLEVNPGAPVLLSSRVSAEVWWESLEATVLPVARHEGRDLVTLFERFTGTPDWDHPETLMAAYERHNLDVRSAVPPARLVDWRPGDGWEPICRALAVPIPDEPFPWVNKREDWG